MLGISNSDLLDDGAARCISEWNSEPTHFRLILFVGGYDVNLRLRLLASTHRNPNTIIFMSLHHVGIEPRRALGFVPCIDGIFAWLQSADREVAALIGCLRLIQRLSPRSSGVRYHYHRRTRRGMIVVILHGALCRAALRTDHNLELQRCSGNRNAPVQLVARTHKYRFGIPIFQAAALRTDHQLVRTRSYIFHLKRAIRLYLREPPAVSLLAKHVIFFLGIALRQRHRAKNDKELMPFRQHASF